MGILSRFSDIIKANINDVIDKMEDPAKMIDQTLRDLTEDLAEVKKETAAVMAEEARASRYVEKIKKDIADYEEAAKKALLAGNEGDATKLLERKQQCETQLISANSTYSVAHANATKMKQMYDKLVNDINILNNKRENIKAQVAMAKAQDHVNKVSAAANAQSAVDKFNRMEAKAQKLLDQATAEAELNATSGDEAEDLKTKYGASTNQSVSDELARLKAEMGLN